MAGMPPPPCCGLVEGARSHYGTCQFLPFLLCCLPLCCLIAYLSVWGEVFPCCPSVS